MTEFRLCDVTGKFKLEKLTGSLVDLNEELSDCFLVVRTSVDFSVEALECSGVIVTRSIELLKRDLTEALEGAEGAGVEVETFSEKRGAMGDKLDDTKVGKVDVLYGVT